MRWFGAMWKDDPGRPFELPALPPKNCIELPCINCLRPIRFYNVAEVALKDQFCNRWCERSFTRGWFHGR